MRPATRGEAAIAALVLAGVALASRAWAIGNPILHIDDEFYLLVGRRMLDGALPYVDIWDRKPIGLFLIYAAAARAFADPVIGYQLLALASVWATALVLFAMARRLTGFWPAVAGAAAYPAWMPVFGGIGGQSPVFYNLPMALAAAILLWLASERRASAAAPGCLAMLLVGLALQIKYSAVFEGVFFGLSLLWLARGGGAGWPRLAALAAVWVACAVLPTALALGYYAAHGHATAFVQANFLSVFHDDNGRIEALARLAGLVAGLTPLFACGWIAWVRRRALAPGSGWVMAWSAASLGGFLAYGVWYDHYVLPILPPLAVLAALAIGAAARTRARRALVAIAVGLGLVAGMARSAIDMSASGGARAFAPLLALVRANLHGGCLYVNDEHPALYRASGGCLATRFAFPTHLTFASYRNGLGVDQMAELRAMLARRPAVIVVNADPHIDDDARADAWALLHAALRRDYRLAGTAQVGEITFAVHALKR